MHRVRSRPTLNIVTHNPNRLVPDDEPSDCVRYRAISVGLAKFMNVVKAKAPLVEKHTKTTVNYFDHTGLLIAQMIWNPNEVGDLYCEHRVFQRS